MRLVIFPSSVAHTNTFHLTRPYVAIKCCKSTSSDQPSAEVKVLTKVRQKARGSQHPGASRIMPLLDDFLVPSSDASHSNHFHQCIVTELVMCLSDHSYDRKIWGSLIRQIMDAFDFLHSHRIIHGGKPGVSCHWVPNYYCADCSPNTDPHIGNIGVEIGSLQGVTESEMEESLQGGSASWMSALIDLETPTHIRTPPEETYDMRIKVLDFGRGKLPNAHIRPSTR